MDLRRSRRIDAAEIQSFLKESKPIPKIRQGMDSPRCAQTVKDSRVSLPFDSLEKAVQRASHLRAIHAGVFNIRPKISLCIVSAHLREASSRRSLDVGQCCDLTPVQLLIQSPLEFPFPSSEFLPYQIHKDHGPLVVIRCLVIQSGNGARQNRGWFGIPGGRKQRNTET